MTLKIVLGFFLATLLALGQGDSGFLHGVVKDSQDAVIPGVTVIVSNEENSCRVTSDGEGRFNCSLPPGDYSLQAELVSILQYHRAPISIRSANHVYVTVRPVFHGMYQGGVARVQDKSFVTINGRLMSVRYEDSEVVEGEHIFSGRFVMLTYEDLAVYAKSISCDRALSVCLAVGDVLVEDGEEQFEGDRCEIDFKAKSFRLERAPFVSRELK